VPTTSGPLDCWPENCPRCLRNNCPPCPRSELTRGDGKKKGVTDGCIFFPPRHPPASPGNPARGFVENINGPAHACAGGRIRGRVGGPACCCCTAFLKLSYSWRKVMAGTERGRPITCWLRTSAATAASTGWDADYDGDPRLVPDAQFGTRTRLGLVSAFGLSIGRRKVVRA